MTRDGFLCFLGFQNFPGEVPRIPLSEVCCNFQSNTAQHKLVENSEVYNSRNQHIHKSVCVCGGGGGGGGGGAASLICDLLAKDLLYPLLVKYRGEKDQDPVKLLENSMLICSLFLEFQ